MASNLATHGAPAVHRHQNSGTLILCEFCCDSNSMLVASGKSRRSEDMIDLEVLEANKQLIDQVRVKASLITAQFTYYKPCPKP